MECTEPTTSGTCSGAVGRGAVAKLKAAAGRCRCSLGSGAGAGSAAELQAAAEAAKLLRRSCSAPTAAAGASERARPPLRSDSMVVGGDRGCWKRKNERQGAGLDAATHGAPYFFGGALPNVCQLAAFQLQTSWLTHPAGLGAVLGAPERNLLPTSSAGRLGPSALTIVRGWT